MPRLNSAVMNSAPSAAAASTPTVAPSRLSCTRSSPNGRVTSPTSPEPVSVKMPSDSVEPPPTGSIDAS